MSQARACRPLTPGEAEGTPCVADPASLGSGSGWRLGIFQAHLHRQLMQPPQQLNSPVGEELICRAMADNVAKTAEMTVGMNRPKSLRAKNIQRARM